VSILECFEPLSPAEQTLLKGAQSGAYDRLGDGGLPRPDDASRVVRADFLRFLVAGGTGAPPLHEKGLRLSGARVIGTLDLEGCRFPREIGLADCLFDSAVVLRSAVIDTLLLDGSILPHLDADALEARCGVYLRGATVNGTVALNGARIGGGLVCDGLKLEHPNEKALAAEGIEVRGGVLLRGAVVRGEIEVAGARLGDDLDFTGATLDNPRGDAICAIGTELRGDVLLRHVTARGRCAFTGARIGGDVDLGGGTFEALERPAFELNRAFVQGAFMLGEGATIKGLLNLNGTNVDTLVDAPDSWPAHGDLALNRFLYKAFLSSPATAVLRLDWLSRQDPTRWGEDFWPQPFEQLAAVLRDTGHNEDALTVLVAKERLGRQARRARVRSAPRRALLRFGDAVLATTIGYGRRPLLAFVWLGLFWASGAAVFSTAERLEVLRPNAPVAIRSPEWVLCGVPRGEERALPSLGVSRAGLALPGQSQQDCYLAQPEAQAFPKFNAWMFALEALLPAVDAGQSSAWAPDTRHGFGTFAKAWVYVLTLVGWALSLLAVAGFSGIVRSR
jgi:hypothetical protein